jgi:hypothetical protein
MYKYISKQSTSHYATAATAATATTDDSQICDKACNNCRLCSKDTRDNNQCWDSCDICNKCNVDYVNAQSYDEPYEYRPWFLSQDNHSFSSVPYTKQYCDNLCGVKTCNIYRQQLSNYQQCKHCKLQGKCWSQDQKRCIDCDSKQFKKSCENIYGCPNPNGYEFANVAPIDPMLNGCHMCWRQK